jgi:outer membrane protein assembly factor BamD
MSLFFARVLPFCLLFPALCLLTATARADLVWTPGSGWRVEGGALAGLTGNEARSALDLMNRARDAEEQGSTRSAIRTYNNVAKRYANSIYAPEALYRAARLQLSRKYYDKAFETFQQLLVRYPNTRRFNEIIGEQYRIASMMLDGARGRTLFGLLPGFTQREKAIQYFENILVNAPYSDYAPLALMNIARGHQRLDHIPDAIDALDRMINNYPQSLLAPDAYLKLAQTHASLVDGPYYDQGSTKESITYFTDFMLLFPGDAGVYDAEQGLDDMKTMLAESKMKIADFYFYKRSNVRAARVFYNEAITAYPDSAIADRAKNRLVQVEALAASRGIPEIGADGPPPASAPVPRKRRFWIF